MAKYAFGESHEFLDGSYSVDTWKVYEVDDTKVGWERLLASMIHRDYPDVPVSTGVKKIKD